MTDRQQLETLSEAIAQRAERKAQIMKLSASLMARVSNDGQTRWCTDCHYDIDRRIAPNHRRAGHHVEA